MEASKINIKSSINKTHPLKSRRKLKMEISPARISLRPFMLTDVDDFIIWAGEDQVTRNLASWKTYASREEAFNFIKEVCIPHPWRRSICLDNRSIGMVTVFRGSETTAVGRADIGYAVGVEHWGKGAATVAVKMATSRVFGDYPDLVRLQGLVDSENKASQRVLEKCGFEREGVLRQYKHVKGRVRDLVVYSILATDMPE